MEPLLLTPEDPYMAYWTKLIMPIYGEETYKKFIEDNRLWLEKSYGLRFSEKSKKQFGFHQKSFSKRFWELLLKGYIGDVIELLLKKTFKKHTLRKSGKLGHEASVIVSDDMLKFHNYDRRKEYLEKWKKLINN